MKLVSDRNELRVYALAALALAALALGFAFLAASSVPEAVAAWRAHREIANAPPPARVSVQRTRLTDAEYRAVAERLATLPGVAHEAGASGLRVFIRDIRQYPQFRAALDHVLVSGGPVVWSVRSVCAGQCRGAAAEAQLTGERLSLAVTSPETRADASGAPQGPQAPRARP